MRARLNVFFAFVASILALTTSPLSAYAQPAAAPGAQFTAADSSYVLGSGDKLRVTTFGEPTLSGEFLVDGTGMVSFPLVGNLKAGGLSGAAFQNVIETALKGGYLLEPRVGVEVLTYRPFYILGEVNKPGTYPYSDGLTVLNAVATAQGFTYRANQKRVFIKRAGGGTEVTVESPATTSIGPGDTIRIAERFF